MAVSSRTRPSSASSSSLASAATVRWNALGTPAVVTGAPADMGRALHAYNPGRRYVRAVTAYARQMRADPRAFLGYHQWQVYYGDTLLPEGYPARRPLVPR